MRSLTVAFAMLILVFTPLLSSATQPYLEPGQARINIGTFDTAGLDAARAILEARYDAMQLVEVRDINFASFVIRENDLGDIFNDGQLGNIVEYIERDPVRYVPEFPDMLRNFILMEEGSSPYAGTGEGSTKGVPNDPSYGNQWGPPCIDSERAWNHVPDNHDIILAIIDTGVDVSHEDLVGNYDPTIDKDFVNNDNDANDDMFHGTHCAGIAAAVTNNNIGIAGLAPVTIMGVKVMSWLGVGSNANIINGINYAANNGAHVISMSLGGTAYSQGLHDACDYAYYTKNVVVVAAAGNDNSSQKTYPAAHPSVIGVAALATPTTRASFSNFGYDNVEISAPGQGIYSTMPDHSTFWNLFGLYPYDYGYLDGTSMACPHVAGVAAGYRAYAPGISARAVRNVLRNNADPLGDPYYYGAGRVDYFPFQDKGETGEGAGDQESLAGMNPALIEEIAQLLQYRQVTVDVVDRDGVVVDSFVRRLDEPGANVPADISNPEDYSYRLKAGGRVSPLFRF